VAQRTLEDRLQTLCDHFEIREVIEAYIHGCDRGDRDAVADVYHPDSWDNHGPIQGDGADFATRCVESLMTVWESCNHLLGQSRIKVSGDTAGAETFYFATLTRDADGVKMLDQQLGRYIDQFERRDGEWRIKNRLCIQEWATTMPLGESFVDTVSFLKGKRSEEDSSYQALGLSRGCSRIER
jgi:ketosteroid isomerase-like protein